MQDVEEEIKVEDVKKGKVLAFLSYFGILAILPFILQPQNEFAVSHGRQGLCLFSWFVAASFFSIMPVLGPLIFLGSSILVFIFMIVGMCNALAGRSWSVPILGMFFE